MTDGEVVTTRATVPSDPESYVKNKKMGYVDRVTTDTRATPQLRLRNLFGYLCAGFYTFDMDCSTAAQWRKKAGED
jgi:hypothetical protein